MLTFLFFFLALVVGGFVGYFYGAEIATHINTALGRPYFRMIISRSKEQGEANIDAAFNSLFIYELERVYKAKGDGGILDPMAPDNEKVAIYVYDIIGNVAENYLPAEPMMGEDIGADIPMMGMNGGEEVKQVVDLGKRNTNSPVDYVE